MPRLSAAGIPSPFRVSGDRKVEGGEDVNDSVELGGPDVLRSCHGV